MRERSLRLAFCFLDFAIYFKTQLSQTASTAVVHSDGERFRFLEYAGLFVADTLRFYTAEAQSFGSLQLGAFLFLCLT